MKFTSYIEARNGRPFAFDRARSEEVSRDLSRIGIHFDRRSMAFDSLTAPLLTASNPTWAQYLQTWMPGFVAMLTTPRKIDELIGVGTIGNWEDEEIIQKTAEHTGKARLYGDYTNVPLSDFGVGAERRGVVRFEMGAQWGKLEETRMAKIDADIAGEKRAAAALALDIVRNDIGFYGYNDGDYRTFGFLNDPNLPAYVAVPDGAIGGGTPKHWSGKTFLEITRDLRLLMAGLLSSSKGIIDPRATPTTVALPLNATPYLSVTSDYGVSVEDWFKKTYPSARIVSATELEAANAGAGVMYAYAETVDDGLSTDDKRVFTQMVPAKAFQIGTESHAKYMLEVWGNASAGVMLKRPYAVYRMTGIS